MGKDFTVARIAVQGNCPLKNQMNSLDPVSLGEKVCAAGETNSRPRPQNALDAFEELVYDLVFVEVESLENGALNSKRGGFLNELEDLVCAVPALFEVTAHR